MSEIFVNGKDTGYRKDSRWWWDANSEDGFRISTNEDYPKEYFAEDHVSEKVVQNYCSAVIGGYELFTGKRLESIIEFGSGGGWFTNGFKRRGYKIKGLEASQSGIDKCENKQMYCVRKVDLRKKIELPVEHFDIALCTEVAGHVEPPFSSMLVHNLTNYADVIWWSSEEPGGNEPHLHHPNEQPYKFWIHLFNFYGYSALRLTDETFDLCERRGRYMFYNSNKYRI